MGDASAQVSESLADLLPAGWLPLLVPLCSPSRRHSHGDMPCRSPGKAAVESRYNEAALRRFADEDCSQLPSLERHIAGGSNVGLVLPPGTFVIDADDQRTASVLAERLPDAPMQQTPRGAHFLVRIDDADGIVRGTKIELGDGLVVDVKVPGQHIASEPSPGYAWKRSLLPSPSDVPEAEAWLLQALRRKPAKANGQGAGQVDGKAISEGARNSTLTSLAGTMRRRGMTSVEIESALIVVNRRCEPPLVDAEVRRIASSVGRYPPEIERIAISSPTPPTEPPWPRPLGDAALVGLAGEFVRVVGPHSEADPAALLLDFLVEIGNVIGRSAHFVAEADRHFANEFSLFVGPTSIGRKGVAHGQSRRPLVAIDPDWARTCEKGGLSSGEGLIYAVRDPVYKTVPLKEQGRIVGYQEEKIDDGVAEKRLAIFQSEFATALRVMARDGNTLSAVIRQAWDHGNLASLTRNSPMKSTDAHVSIIAHITRDELLRDLDRTECANGFLNRFLIACVKRSKLLPDGGSLQSLDLAPFHKRLARAIEFGKTLGEVHRNDEARALWHEVYPSLTEGSPGLLGAVTSRAAPHAMRLALIYAVLDRSSIIKRVHLEAALDVWRFCFESARHVFGDALGDPTADEVIRRLREAPEGLTRTEINRGLGGHRKADAIDRALGKLAALNLARREFQETEGRTAERWLAVEPDFGRPNPRPDVDPDRDAEEVIL